MPIRKLFFSYRNSPTDVPKADRIAEQLRQECFPDTTDLRYDVWQDKHSLPPASPHWWDAIVEAIAACDVLIFALSEDSLSSPFCLAELEYAHRRGRPVVPVVLEGEHVRVAGKHDVKQSLKAKIPAWLSNHQYIFDDGGNLCSEINAVMDRYERKGFPLDAKVTAPLDPTKEAVYANPHKLYQAAVAYAEQQAFTDAERCFHELVTRQHKIYESDSRTWIEIIDTYKELLEMDHPATRKQFESGKKAYQQRFPVDFIDGIFDPHGLFTASPPPPPIQVVTPPPTKVVTPPPPPRDPLAEKLAQARTFTGTRNTDWKPIIVPLGELVAGTPMPKLEMCLVPVGAFKMGAGSEAHPQSITTPYWIARYTVTNAQWREGVQAGAVNEPSYTTWYKDSAMADCPVAYVRWYQALAFARWARCTLPSELETEYAGRGVESWVYPWGNEYDAKHVVDWDDPTYGKKNPAPVTYKPEGASWVGAMQLSGNVWEWQRSLYKGYPYQAEDGRENVNENISKMRVLRGGSFYDPAFNLRSAVRYYRNPADYFNYTGFRCAFSLNSSAL